MTESSSVDVILDFLRRNHFTRAEAALRIELGNRPDLNGFLQKLTLEGKDSSKVLGEEKGEKTVNLSHGSGSRNSGEVSKELIIKEIECGAGRNGSESKYRNAASTEEHKKPNEAKVISDKSFTFSKNSEENVLNLQSRNFNTINGSDLYKNGGFSSSSSFPELEKQDRSTYCTAEAPETEKSVKSGEEIMFLGEIKSSWLGNTSKANVGSTSDKLYTSESKELDQQFKMNSVYLKDNFADNSKWSRIEEPTSSFSDIWKDCSVKTVLPFPEGDVSIRYDAANTSDKREGKKKAYDLDFRAAYDLDVRAAIKEQVDEVERALFFGKSQGTAEQMGIKELAFPLASENPKEKLPRLPPVKLKSEEKSLNVNWEEKYEPDVPGAKLTGADSAFLIGSYLDVPIGQEISSSGWLI
ncbi:putative phagocytic receptor 1b-like [Hibiscus syriacus]|uniref:Phagocytic receptor 1b-like n=1 Tax=Hibiscus syriacus TaxID=106335 RepID=A0A6A3B392_HIBSY|nr:putative phagocytic receptor 1b-like [Hibiscus syriacus]